MKFTNNKSTPVKNIPLLICAILGCLFGMLNKTLLPNLLNLNSAQNPPIILLITTVITINGIYKNSIDNFKKRNMLTYIFKNIIFLFCSFFITLIIFPNIISLDISTSLLCGIILYSISFNFAATKNSIFKNILFVSFYMVLTKILFGLINISIPWTIIIASTLFLIKIPISISYSIHFFANKIKWVSEFIKDFSLFSKVSLYAFVFIISALNIQNLMQNIIIIPAIVIISLLSNVILYTLSKISNKQYINCNSNFLELALSFSCLIFGIQSISTIAILITYLFHSYIEKTFCSFNSSVDTNVLE